MQVVAIAAAAAAVGVPCYCSTLEITSMFSQILLHSNSKPQCPTEHGARNKAALPPLPPEDM
eukprot:4673649-Amphidinium_carterae.1